MEFISLASSSKGNLYMVKADGAAPLLIEAGLPLSAIRDKLREHGVSLSDLAGVLVSHEHLDHARGVKDLLPKGIDCFMSRGTAEELEVWGHYRVHPLFQDMTEGIGPWRVNVFPLEHDAREPLGFVVSHGTDRLLFIPDTGIIHHTFTGITLAAAEANHVTELLVNNVMEGHLPACVGRRIGASHMSLENLITMLKAQDLSRCQQIFLLHLSDGNSDEARMVREVERAVGIPTTAC